MHLKSNRVLLIMAVLMLFISMEAFAKNKAIKDAAKAVNQIFLSTDYIANVPILRYGHHYVLPNGELAPNKKQGRGGEHAIQFGSNVRVNVGEIGQSIMIVPRKKEIWVGLNKVRGKAMNSDTVHILFNRKIVPSDITPEKIAQAIAKIAEIKGYVAKKNTPKTNNATTVE